MNSRAHATPVLAGIEWAAKIGLGVSVVACAGLLVVLFALPDDAGTSYASIVAANSLASRNLGPALLVFGLAVAVFAGAFTWLIALYGSFRVAGPIYRFEQNLRRELEHRGAPLVPIRRTDELQEEWMEFRAGVTELRELYAELSTALAAAERAAPPSGTVDAQALGRTVDNLKSVTNRVQL